MIAHDTIPRELLDSSRAVLWNYVEVPDRPKPTKVPFQVRRPETKASTTDPATWGPMREAILAAADGKADGVGIVVGDGLSGLDIDDCVDPVTGALTPRAAQAVAEANSYTEYSPGGLGIRIFTHGVLPTGRRSRELPEGGKFEMYDGGGRYLSVTGRHVPGTPTTIEERTAALAAIHAREFGKPPSPPKAPPSSRDDLGLDDSALLAKASAAKNGVKFSALWGGDTSAYNGDDSAADQAICNLLAFWTDRDAFRIDRLFRQSGLMRPKWDERRGAQTYAELTIARALESCTEGYTSRPEASQPTESEPSTDDTAPRLIAERFPAFAVRLATRERPDDIVPDLIPGTGITMPHGQPRSLKTWGQLDIATACATGGCVFGLERFRVREPLETWYLTEEDGEIDTHGRLAALLAGREQDAPASLHVSIHKGIDLDDPRTQALLIEYAKDYRIRVTIADPIRSVSAMVDQGPRELKPLAKFLRRYMRETGSIWVLGHHDVKPLAGKPDDRPKPQRASGGGIFSIADSPIHVERLGTIGSRAIFTPSLYKGSATPDPVIVELTTDDPKRPTWAVLRGDISSAPDAEGAALHQQIGDYLREHPETSSSAVAKAIRKRKDSTLAALEDLHRTGAVTFAQRGQARLWSMLSQEAV